jgi:endonuclease YncB( thermonuclease family)
LVWQGKVVGVADGDTITVMHEGRGEKIRIYGVACPESHQDFGQKAKKFTSNMTYGKSVEVEPIAQDRYGRTVALVKTDRQ